MRSWIRPRNSASEPSTRSAARVTVTGGAALNAGAALRRRIRAIGAAILAPRISLCQLAIQRKHLIPNNVRNYLRALLSFLISDVAAGTWGNDWLAWRYQ